MAARRICVGTLVIAALAAHGCSATSEEGLACIDDDGAPTACEFVDDDSASVGDPPASAASDDWQPSALVDDEEAAAAIASTREVAMGADPDTAAETIERSASFGVRAAGDGTVITGGPTDRAELRKLLPIGRTAGVTRFVVLRLRPSDLPKLAVGDMLRAAAELQVTTECDIGQTGPSCGYAPHVRLQLLLTGNPDGTNPQAAGTVPLSGVKKFDCTADDHHCVKAIDFSDGSRRLGNDAPPCVASDSCFVNLVAWAYHGSARGSGKDKLIIGANEGNYLLNGKVEQDRARIMAVRERNVPPADVSLHVTDHNVKKDPIRISSGDPRRPIYLHALNGGRDLRAGEKFRVWAEVHASANHRMNLRLEMFLTKKKSAASGSKFDGVQPGAISEHNGTNCSPGNDCRLHKVAVFEAKRDIAGPVFVDIAAYTEVPGPGSATTTIHDDGFVKVVRYAP